MERREDALKQALEENARETERWQRYKTENDVAIQNLNTFSKRLTVEVMVPIGKKGLMPGELIHTNELLVGHYQGYFSTCSAHKAKEICQRRLAMADEHLKKLQVEAELWQNNLETPLLEGALPKSDEIEIIEEYNEIDHKNWLREHKERVRKEKLEERAEREANANTYVDILQKLEERELLEELGLDPENYNEQTLNGLLENEAQSEKDESINCDNEYKSTKTDEEIFKMLDKLEAEEENDEYDNDEEVEQNLQSTNELVRNLMSGQTPVTPAKPRLGAAKNNVIEPNEPTQINVEDQDSEDDEDDESDHPEEVKLIREQMQILPSEERQEFLQTQLQIIKAKMRKVQKVSFISDELTHLMNVVVCLEDDLQEMLFEQGEAVSTEELTDESASIEDSLASGKRRISFAEVDQQLLFNQDEAVAKMLKTNKKSHQREIIQLDAPTLSEEQEVCSPKQKSPQIMEKVEKNLRFVQENQSMQDFDLVSKILEASMGANKTLHISFNHSDAPSDSTEYDKTLGPSTPAHFYEIYKRALSAEQEKNSFPIYVNSYEGEDQLKVPILKEEQRAAAYDDPRLRFNKSTQEIMDQSQLKADASGTEMKSILRNKLAVNQEPRAEVNQPNTKKNKNSKKKKERTLDDGLQDISAYQKVMQDLFEKEPTVPEPLPEGKFIDAHAPKKRISRFKEQRSTNKT